MLFDDVRVQLKDETGKAFVFRMSEKALVEFNIFERAGGLAQACIIPVAEKQYWDEGRQVDAFRCTAETREKARGALILAGGEYALGVRCASTVRNCDVSYTATYAPVHETG